VPIVRSLTRSITSAIARTITQALRGRAAVDVAVSVPVMTGYTTPAGVVAESTTFGGGLQGWKVFDDDATSTSWFSAELSVTNQWISYNFGFPVSVRELSFTAHPGAPARSPNIFRLEYLSGGTWTAAHTGVGATSESAQTFAIADVGKFAEWRLFIVTNHGDINYIALRNLEFNGFRGG